MGARPDGPLRGRPALRTTPTRVLKSLGYWTDNGAAYYYHFDPRPRLRRHAPRGPGRIRKGGPPARLRAARQLVVPEGRHRATGTRRRTSGSSGSGRTRRTPTSFPRGLPAFRDALGLPLLTHARWIDEKSPYRKQYRMSNNVVIDPPYWDDDRGLPRGPPASSPTSRTGSTRRRPPPTRSTTRTPSSTQMAAAIGIARAHDAVLHGDAAPPHAGLAVRQPHDHAALGGHASTATAGTSSSTPRGSPPPSASGRGPTSSGAPSGTTCFSRRSPPGVVGVGDALDEIVPENLRMVARPDGDPREAGRAPRPDRRDDPRGRAARLAAPRRRRPRPTSARPRGLRLRARPRKRDERDVHARGPRVFAAACSSGTRFAGKGRSRTRRAPSFRRSPTAARTTSSSRSARAGSRSSETRASSRRSGRNASPGWTRRAAAWVSAFSSRPARSP